MVIYKLFEEIKLIKSKPKVILINFLAVTDGGQVTRAEAFLDRYRQYDKNSRLIILKRKHSLEFCNKVQGAKIVDIKLIESSLRPWYRLFWENTFLLRILKKEKPQIYLTFSHYLPMTINKNILSIVGVTNLAPFIKESMRNEPFLMKLKMFILKIGIINSTKRANKVIALSGKCKRVLQSNGIKGEKISVINNGVQNINAINELKANVKRDYDIPTDYFLYVSSFFPYKRFETVIKSYELLPEHLKDEFSLILVGTIQDKKYFDTLVRMVKNYELETKILFLPEVSKTYLFQLYKNTDLFIFASSVENCPNILLEAMSNGCCVLCSSDEPMPEFGSNAVEYFDSSNAKDLSMKISNLMQNKDKREILKNSALVQSKSFSWDNFTSNVIHLYDS